jgi:hypothetical protein
MRGLPDSAVFGTYKRMSRIGKPRRRKNYQADVVYFYAVIDALDSLVKKLSKK